MEIDIRQIAFQILNFGIILYVLTKFLYKPVLKMLSSREEKINEGLTAAENNLKAAEEIEKTKKAEIAKARREATKIIKDAELEATTKAKAIVKNAKEEAKKESEVVRKRLEAEFSQKEKELENNLAKLVIETTKSALKDSLSQSEVEKITKSTVASLK